MNNLPEKEETFGQQLHAFTRRHEARIELAEKLKQLYELILLIDQSLESISNATFQPIEALYLEEESQIEDCKPQVHWKLETFYGTRILLRFDGVLVSPVPLNGHFTRPINLTDLSIGQIELLKQRIVKLAARH